jgi:uncharacterized protein (UPF0332 family)
LSASKRLSKAQTSLVAARLLLKEGLESDACSRAYYAMFDAARAALAASDAPVSAKKARTHSGAISAFNLYLIKTEILPAVHGPRLSQAHQARLMADYQGDSVAAEEASAIVGWASELIDSVKTAFALD